MELLSPKPVIEPTVIRQIVVRPARDGDQHRIRVLDATCFHRQLAEPLGSAGWSDVAETEHGICGYALTCVRGPLVFIDRIAVFSDCREQGIGSALIEGIVARAQQQRRKRVVCFSSEYAPASTHSFLANRGFWSRIHPAPQRLRRPVDTPDGEKRRGIYVFTREMPSEVES